MVRVRRRRKTNDPKDSFVEGCDDGSDDEFDRTCDTDLHLAQETTRAVFWIVFARTDLARTFLARDIHLACSV